MATIRELESKITLLEKGLKSKATKPALKVKMREQVSELKKKIKVLERASDRGLDDVAKAKRLAKKKRSEQARQSLKDKDIESDANRYAINKTKRRSHGGRANQYGTKAENKGGTYYEKRENRYDRQNKRYAKLEHGGMMAKGGQVSGYFTFSPYETQGNFFMSTTLKGVSPDNVMRKGVEGKLKGNDMNSAEEIAHVIMQEHPYVTKLDIIKRGATTLKNKKVATFQRDDSGEYQIEYFMDGGETYGDGGYATKRELNQDYKRIITNKERNEFETSQNSYVGKIVTIKLPTQVNSFKMKVKNEYATMVSGGGKNGGVYSKEYIISHADGGMMAHGGILDVAIPTTNEKEFKEEILNSDVYDIEFLNNIDSNGGKYAIYRTNPDSRKNYQYVKKLVAKYKGWLKNEYADGGAINDFGGTTYSTEDLSGMFANGGETHRREDGMYAKGGMTEHGLRIGDKILSAGTTLIIVENYDGLSRVSLNKGTREYLGKKQDVMQ